MRCHTKHTRLSLAIALSSAVPAMAQTSVGNDPFTEIPADANLGKYSVQGSSDGGDVIAGVLTKANTPNKAYIWTAQRGVVTLGTLNNGNSADARAINAGGDVVVGMAEDGTAPLNPLGAQPKTAYRWTERGGMQGLGPVYANGSAIPTGNSFATGVNAAGDVVVGVVYDQNNQTTSIFRWTQQTRMVALGKLNGGNNAGGAYVNAAGDVIVGNAQDGSLANTPIRAVRWTEATGLLSLGTLNATDTESRATAVNAKGDIVVGTSTAAGGMRHGFRWTQQAGATAGAMEDLGNLNGGTDVTPYAINAAGNVVVGTAKDGNAANAVRGFRWAEGSGMQTVEAWLAANGVAPAATQITANARAVSTDGSTVVGQLTNGAMYIARVVAAPPASTPTTAQSTPPATAQTSSPAAPLNAPPAGAQQADAPATAPASASAASSHAAGVIGSGLIVPESFNRGLARVAQSKQLALNDTELVMNGMHSNPMRGLLSTGKSAVWTAGDLGRAEHGDHDSDVGVAEIGIGHRVHDLLQLNVSLGRTFSRSKTDLGGRTIARGTYVMPEAIVTLPASLYLTASALYGQGEVDIERGYLNAGRDEFVSASPDQRSAGARLRLDWKDAAKWDRTALTPYVSLTYLQTRTDGYTERGGAFPVKWDRRTDRATTARVGIDLIHEVSPRITLQGRMEGAHRFDRTDASSSGEVIGLYAFHFDGPRAMRNWLRFGAGAEAKVGAGVAGLMLNATTRGDVPSYWASVNYRWQF
ncbi:autotransporter domain-containing protein [Achromobacter xylosoxidans]|uniref:autotransporter domain-containing protein n=1 Tax=Alcaligenes xylosoxydans xylosoxydans TaxID=85698 RepID=UPI001EEE367D|nr:autotransporter domain-containing protein [Achromobacter xylosoxidans]